MEYTVQKLSKVAGVSPRTLRYYDEVGILKPLRISTSGYRIYGQNEVDRLQQILFYRELGVSLEGIRDILNSADFDGLAALKDHRRKLLEKQDQLDVLLANVEQTITAREGMIKMRDEEKFAGFKQTLIEQNEQKYGKELRAKYGNEAVDRSNAKITGMSQKEYAAAEQLAIELKDTLKEAFKTGNPAGELAQKAADLHRRWLCTYWDHYSKEAHANLAQMYVDDERFTAYYDKEQPGTAVFLRDAIRIYTGVGKD